MSRYVSEVDVLPACEVFDVKITEATKRLIEVGELQKCIVAHGYDHPLNAYFCDIETVPAPGDREVEEYSVGIYYGRMGLTKRLNKGEYYEAMKKLGLEQAAAAVAFDVPY
jgi:hypothetical protein